MIARATALLASLLLLAVPLRAQEGAPPTFDLQRAYRWKAGDKVRVQELRDQTQRVVIRSGLQVVDEQNQRQGFEQRYLIEVTKVDERGRISEATRTYESLRDVARGEALAVEGLKVRWVRQADGALGWEPPQGATLDPFVREVLDEDLEGKDEGGEAGEPEPMRLLLAPKPVAVGESWELPLAEVGDAFGVVPADVVEKQLTGKLAAVEPPAAAGGPTFLQVTLEVRLKSKTFQGRACPRPVEYTLSGTARLPAGGESPARKLRLEGLIRGAAPAEEPGSQVEFEVRLQQEETHERVP
jgi:hypothetical protein